MPPIIINNIDLNQFRSFIENRVTGYTGRQLKLNGDLGVNLSLHPSFKVEQVTFGNASWGDQPNMISVESLELKIDLMPLLDGQLVFETLRLKGVVLLLEKNSVGQENWLLGESDDAEEGSAIMGSEQEPFEMPVAPVFRQVRFDEVHIQYSDTNEKIETDIDIEVLNFSNHVINKPFSFNTNGTINGRPFNALGEAGLQSAVVEHVDGVPLVVKLDANILDITLAATGEIKQPIVKGGVNIDISLISKDLNKSFVLATGQSLNQYSVNTNQVIPFQLSVNFSNLEGDYELSNIKLKLADSDLKGKLSLKLNSDRPKLYASLSSKKININRVLKKRSNSNEFINEDVFSIPEINLDFSWLNNIDADVRYRASQILVDGFAPKEILVSATLSKGQLQIKQFDFNIGDALYRSHVSIDGRKREPVIGAVAKIKNFDLLLLGKYLDVSTLQQGKLNADINVKGVGENIETLIMSLGGKSRFQLQQLQLNQNLNGKNHNVYVEMLELSFTEMSAPVTLSLSGELDKEKVVMSGEFFTMASLLNNRNTHFVVKANVFEANLFADMVSLEPIFLKSLQADLSLSIPSLVNSFGNVVRVFPEVNLGHEIPALQTSVNAQLNFSKNSVVAKNISILIGNNDFQGDAAIDASKKKINISLDLSSDLLDINSLLPSDGGKLVGSNESSKTDKIFSTEPLPSFKFLNNFNADIRYQLKKLSANNESVNNVSLNLVVYDGELRIEPLKLSFEKGEIRANLVLSDRDKFQVQVSSTIKNIDYDKLMALLAVKEFAKGEFDAEINLHSTGDSVSQLLAALNGQIRVTTEGGSMNSGAIHLLSKDVSSLIPFTGKSDRQKIRCAVAQFNIEDGLAKTHALVFDTGTVSALGVGEINLATEKIDLYVAPRTKRTSVMKLALVPLNVRGSLASPSITPDVAGSAISTTNTAVHISLAVATGGITLLAEGLTNKLWEQYIDDTDYCALALAGEKIVPTLVMLKDGEEEIDEDGIDSDYIEELDDDEF